MFVQFMNVSATMSSRIVQLVAVCFAAIRGFVPWVTSCFLSHSKNMWKNHRGTSRGHISVLDGGQEYLTDSSLPLASNTKRLWAGAVGGITRREVVVSKGAIQDAHLWMGRRGERRYVDHLVTSPTCEGFD